MRNGSTGRLCASALLIAIGILIPMFSPVKILLEPGASFTLASHVPVFLAIMISPAVGVAVALGTTLGFFFGGFPFVVVLRAASHLVFASLGAFYLQRVPSIRQSPVRIRAFSLVVGLVHGLCEVIVVSSFYFGGQMSRAHYQEGFLASVLLLVGFGSLVHSMIDFEIALIVARALEKQKGFSSLRGEA